MHILVPHFFHFSPLLNISFISVLFVPKIKILIVIEYFKNWLQFCYVYFTTIKTKKKIGYKTPPTV